MLEAKDLRLQLGDRYVLRGVSFSLQPGHCLALFGANGAGKTSLLSILALQRAPSAGSLRLFGAEAAVDDLALRRRLGYLGHEPGVFLGLTGYENLLLYARLYGLENAKQRALDGLRRVGLAPFRNTPVRNYSAGMRQRLGLARTLLHRPELLLLDEPHQSLDHRGQDILDRLVAEHCGAGGAALVATHETERALGLATDVMVLSRGKVSYLAPIAETPRATFEKALGEGRGGGGLC